MTKRLVTALTTFLSDKEAGKVKVYSKLEVSDNIRAANFFLRMCRVGSGTVMRKNLEIPEVTIKTMVGGI